MTLLWIIVGSVVGYVAVGALTLRVAVGQIYPGMRRRAEARYRHERQRYPALYSAAARGDEPREYGRYTYQSKVINWSRRETRIRAAWVAACWPVTVPALAVAATAAVVAQEIAPVFAALARVVGRGADVLVVRPVTLLWRVAFAAPIEREEQRATEAKS